MSKLAEIISQNEERIRKDWIAGMTKAVQRADLMSKVEVEEQSRAILTAIVEGTMTNDSTDLKGPAWESAKDLLRDLSASRARQGFTPTETATFVLSLKQPLFSTVQREVSDSQEAVQLLWSATQIVDRLALLTTEAFIQTRDELVIRQQQELLELSTPVVKLWQGILALPIIGTLDSARTQIVMENLLQAVVATNSKFAIIDITGVPTVDTLVAQHLLKTITAARLMGAECIISGIRPQIAQTIVHLGINLQDVITKANLSDAFALALQRSGAVVVRHSANGAAPKPAPVTKEG